MGALPGTAILLFVGKLVGGHVALDPLLQLSPFPSFSPDEVRHFWMLVMVRMPCSQFRNAVSKALPYCLKMSAEKVEQLIGALSLTVALDLGFIVICRKKKSQPRPCVYLDHELAYIHGNSRIAYLGLTAQLVQPCHRAQLLTKGKCQPRSRRKSERSS